MTPDSFTIKEFFLDVGDGHQLYVHDWGNKDAAAPIVFLHGGPGSRCKDKYKLNYDPHEQRVIFFDQRGAGKSLPKGELANNTTDDLVEDIEKIIRKLKLPKVSLTGGSWGSCLALAYGVKHPHNVKGMVLNGIFTGRKSEIEHLDSGGFRAFFPDLWERYVDSVPKSYKHNPSKYYYEKAFDDDALIAKKAAYSYSTLLEGPIAKLDDRYEPEPFDDFDPTAMKIELYYLKNNCFLPENHIIASVYKLTMPIWLIQGRYDMICPPTTAYELQQKLPNAKLIWAMSGHLLERESWNALRILQALI